MRRREFLLTAAGLGAAATLAAAARAEAAPLARHGRQQQRRDQRRGQGDLPAVRQLQDPGELPDEMAKKFTAAHPQATVKLQPIVASENDYYTKLQLSMRSPRTAPDMCYEDTFLINSDIAAGYLSRPGRPISSWPDWSQFKDTAKTAAKALDGKTYGIPDGTDTRALWFNKKIFEKAGLPTDWQPKSWDDIMTAARTIKQKVPGVIPLNVYAGTGVGEAASMQGFEMLLYGIPTGTLYDKQSQKWVVGSKAFNDALTFYQQVCSEGLGPTPQQALAPTWANTVAQELLPQDKLAIDLDGCWLSEQLAAQRCRAVAGVEQVLGNAYMPTQNGEGSGKVTMSGGWTWAIPKNAQNANAAWEFIKMLTSKEGELEFDIKNVQIPVRSDVAEDPSYVKANPTNAFFSDLVESTIYRPAYAEYAKISLLLQQATEKVITNTADPAAAAKFYDDGVKQIVGQDKVTTALMATWAEVRPTAPPARHPDPDAPCCAGLPVVPSRGAAAGLPGRSDRLLHLRRLHQHGAHRPGGHAVRRVRQLHPGLHRRRVLVLGRSHADLHGRLGDHRPERAGHGAGAADAVGLRRGAGADVGGRDRRLGAARGRRGLPVAGGARPGRLLELDHRASSTFRRRTGSTPCRSSPSRSPTSGAARRSRCWSTPPRCRRCRAISRRPRWSTARAGFRLLISVTIPLVRRTIATNLMLITLQTLSVFGLIYTMTKGGPSNKSMTLPLFAYNQAFVSADLGYGTAIALLLLLIGGIFSVVYLRGTEQVGADPMTAAVTERHAGTAAPPLTRLSAADDHGCRAG